MERRKLFRMALLAGLGFVARPTFAGKSADADGDAEGIDPYFLQRGEIPAQEKENIQAFVSYQDKTMQGLPAILPRGGKPKRAPTFRFLHLDGQLGDPDARLVGPLSIQPTAPLASAYRVNAQILGLNCSTDDWSGKGGGTLTCEIRGQQYGESMTWLYVEQFSVVAGGGTSVGLSYIAQREGTPDPVISEEPTLDLRIQLIRHRKSPGVLRKILKVGSFLTGVPMAGGSPQSSFNASQPAVRVPRMAYEGVAFTQATVGSMSDEAPIWKSGFNSFALAPGAGHMALTPGIWVAVDDSPDIDYGAIRAADLGGRVGLTVDGAPFDANYLVLAFEIASD